MKKFFQKEVGGTLIEAALVIALIAMIAIIPVRNLMGPVGSIVCDASVQLRQAGVKDAPSKYYSFRGEGHTMVCMDTSDTVPELLFGF